VIQGSTSAVVWTDQGEAGKLSDIFVGILDGTRYIGLVNETTEVFLKV
jgi:hypothetical protein